MFGLSWGWYWSLKRVALGFYLSLVGDEFGSGEVLAQINLLFLSITIYRKARW